MILKIFFQASSQATTETTEGSKSSSGAAGPIQLSDLQKIFLGITSPSDGSGGGAAREAGLPVDLGTAMTSEALQSILTNEEFVEQLKPFLPQTEEVLPPVEQLRGTVASPQFQQVSLIKNSSHIEP